MTDMDQCTWQQQGEPDEWVFGPLVRGIVRDIHAEVYFDEAGNYGWVWMAYQGGKTVARGEVVSLKAAIKAAESCLGITE